MISVFSRRSLDLPSVVVHIGVCAVLALLAIALYLRMIRNGIIVQADDVTSHMLWIEHFSAALQAGSLYPRWLPDANYGYGSSAFIFYPPLVYYLGAALKSFHLSVDVVVLWLYIIATFGAGINFYFYGQLITERRIACLGAILYMSSPYIVVNTYVRGALAEAFGVALLPLGLWAIHQAVSKPRWRIGLALFFAILALTHLPSLVIVTFSSVLYITSLLLRYSWRAVLSTASMMGLGLAIASFYLLPALLERSLVNIQTMTSRNGNFRQHLFGSPSFIDYNTFTRDRILTTFIYGVCLAIGFALLALWANYKNRAKRQQVLIWLGWALGVMLIMSTPSTLLWQSSKTLSAIQFPWRFLGVFTLVVAILGTLALDRIVNQKATRFKSFLLVLFFALFAANVHYSLDGIIQSNPGFYALINFYEKADQSSKPVQQDARARRVNRVQRIVYFHNDEFRDQTAFLPLLANGQVVPTPQPDQPPIRVVAGAASFDIVRWQGDRRIIDATASQPSTVSIRTHNYPIWRLSVDQAATPIMPLPDGTIGVQLTPWPTSDCALSSVVGGLLLGGGHHDHQQHSCYGSGLAQF